MTSPPRDGCAARQNARLTRDERMRTDREFREVVRTGERAHTPHYTVYRDRKGETRKVGISAGRRVGGAVVRNRLKRVLREFFRLNKDAFPEGTRTAVVVRKTPPETGLAAVRAELLPAIAGRWGLCGPGRSS